MGEGGFGGSPARRAAQAAKNQDGSTQENEGPNEESRDQEARGQKEDETKIGALRRRLRNLAAGFGNVFGVRLADHAVAPGAFGGIQARIGPFDQ
jgi:hypothetical protein